MKLFVLQFTSRERARKVMRAFGEAKVPNAMPRAGFLLKRPLASPPTTGAATEWNLDYSTDSVADLLRGRTRRRRELDTSVIEKI